MSGVERTTEELEAAGPSRHDPPLGSNDPKGVESDLPHGWWRWRSLFGVAAVVLAAVVFGLRASNAWIDIANTALIASIAAVALNLLLGHTGLVSIGNAAFLAVGAVVAAQVADLNGGPFWLAALAGTGAAAFVGLLLAIPAGRIKGLYLAMGTLAFHFIVVATVQEVQTRQVGSGGYRLPTASIAGFEVSSIHRWYVLLLVCLTLTLLFVRALLTRKPGRAWRAIREQQSIAAMSGISVWRYKVWAFVVSSAIVGFAGVLSAYYISIITSETFVLHLAVLYLAYVIIGGMGSMYGPVIGAFFLVSLPHLVKGTRSAMGFDSTGQNIFYIQDAAIGAAVVLMILIEPLGLARLGSRALRGIERRVGSAWSTRVGRRGAA